MLPSGLYGEAPMMAGRSAILGLRFLPRLVPILGWALLAFELAQLLKWYFQKDQWDTTGYERFWLYGEKRSVMSRERNKPPNNPFSSFTNPLPARLEGRGWMWSGPGYLEGTIWKFPLGEGWRNIPGVTPKVGSPFKRPDMLPFSPPVEQPAVMPWLDPLAQPVNAPQPAPQPMPWPIGPARSPNPMRDPWEQRQVGPGRVVRPRAPNDRIVIEPGKGVRVDNPPYRPGPPPRGTKERKFIANLDGRSLIGRIVNFASESADWIDAFYDALPANRRGAIGAFQKAKAVIDHFDEIELGKAFQNVVENEIEDRIFGSIGKVGGKASRRLGEWSGRPVGIDTGGAFSPYR